MKCVNCGNEIDFDFLVDEEIFELLEYYEGDKEKVKNFLDTEFDFSIDQACDYCYHTLWVEGEDRNAYYETLERLAGD